ncbi:MAG: Asp-tRNA(Asn)/Glu-tRNA(Gln) amidotransferase subunit GatA [Candidatus Omnitrophica bacterium]|nr:Asp-tRNA(Asn)/Glu-tRNA(Gln) amidotransferase subunit GatA [Candidatus Omnitrophota bacterium]
MGLNQRTALDLIESVKRGKINSSDIIKDVLKRIKDVDSKINAFAHLNSAEDLFKNAEGKKSGRLAGIPVALKDNLCENDRLTTCSSKILSGFKPPYSATVVKKLEDEGAIILGKTNMDEFAFGSSCETSCYGTTRNPWDTKRIPGGSSGGSAAAVAADEAVMALGSDTGGSIRQPAALCGVVGMKPTYGRVSRYGLIAFASSLDQIGPITKDVSDCALLLSVISGHDESDSTSADMPVPDYTDFLGSEIRGMRAGVPKEYFVEGSDPEVEKSVRKAIETFRGMGVEIVELDLPHTKYAVGTYYIIASAEASSNLSRFDGVQYGHRSSSSKDIIDLYSATRSEGFGDEAKRRIMLGAYVLSSGYYDAYYLKASKVRTKIKEDFDNAFKKCDVILTPTSPTPAFKAGEKMNDPLNMYLSDVYTIPANLAGIPAVSVPCGFTKSGLPIGLQIIAQAFREDNIIKAAHAFEVTAKCNNRKPDLG